MYSIFILKDRLIRHIWKAHGDAYILMPDDVIDKRPT
jgi:hypothetical protein